MTSISPPDGHILVVCEKPDAARRVAEALSDNAFETSRMSGATVFKFSLGPKRFVVCSALGHLYSISDPFDERSVYPTFDAEWYPLDSVDEKSKGVKERITAFEKLARGAGQLVNACDFDVEGETIGFNILRYACHGREKDSARVRFSALTKKDITEAFGSPLSQEARGMAAAGRARHLIDFVWGVNFSRALSRSGSRYRTVSIGRVQGPTLMFLAAREREIRQFEPRQFWRVTGIFRNSRTQVEIPHSKGRLFDRSEAEGVRDDCIGKEGTVASLERSLVDLPPFPPFNTGDMQKEAFRVLGFSPTQTMRAAERLYLAALISYPRTESQRLPQSIDLKPILGGLERQPAYAGEVKSLLAGRIWPREGTKTDRAHPAIHPTGERPRRRLEQVEAKLYDLVVRRFLSALAPTARRESVALEVAVGKNEFRLEGNMTVQRGWLDYYGRYYNPREAGVPPLVQGDKMEVVKMVIEEGFEEKPSRYSQGSLLEKMERERIGTKSTRADTILTLFRRGYVAGESLTLTELGLAVARIIERNVPMLASTELTRRVEEGLEGVEEGKEDEKDLLRESVRSAADQLVRLAANEDSIGREIDGAVGMADAASILGACPLCGEGKLRVIRSRRTRKRFVGCTNYSAGCNATAPLPQRGDLKNPFPCPLCSWPILEVTGRWRPWRFCVNLRCHSNQGRSRHGDRGRSSRALPPGERSLWIGLKRMGEAPSGRKGERVRGPVE